MPGSIPIGAYFAIFFVGVVVLGIVLGALGKKRRRSSMMQAAQAMGMDFIDRDESLLSAAFRLLGLFQRGRRRVAYNIMEGMIEDLRAFIFDYRFVTGGGKNRHTHRYTVVAFMLARPTLTAFELRPEGLFHKIGTLFGYQDIDLAEHPKFSRRYLLRGPDEDAIRQKFTPALIEQVMQHPRFCAEATGGWLIVYRRRGWAKPDRLAGFLDEAFTLCNQMS